MGTLTGEVALITGAARGQGWSHAIRLEQDGADIIALDRRAPFDTVPYTLKAAVPTMSAGAAGGSIVLTSSTAGLRGLRSMADYTATKHGVVGLMRTFANELAEHGIRVNSVHPTGVNTDMVTNPALRRWYEDNPSMAANVSGNLLPVDLVEAADVSEAVAWLASDAARYVTGVTLPVDADFIVKV